MSGPPRTEAGKRYLNRVLTWHDNEYSPDPGELDEHREEEAAFILAIEQEAVAAALRAVAEEVQAEAGALVRSLTVGDLYRREALEWVLEILKRATSQP